MAPRIKLNYQPFDAELGRPSSSRLARRIFARRGRWIVGAIIAGVVCFYLYDMGSSGVAEQLVEEVEEVPWLDGIKGDGKAIDYDGPESPTPTVEESTSDSNTLDDLDYIVDAYGDHFYPDYPASIPSFDPDLSLLPRPQDLLSEINLQTIFRPPTSRSYPSSRIDEIVSPPPAVAEEFKGVVVPPDAFVSNWTGEEVWNPPRNLGKSIQVKSVEQSRDVQSEQEERARAVKRGFAHAWQAYKDHAWGESIQG